MWCEYFVLFEAELQYCRHKLGSLLSSPLTGINFVAGHKAEFLPRLGYTTEQQHYKCTQDVIVSLPRVRGSDSETKDATTSRLKVAGVISVL